MSTVIATSVLPDSTANDTLTIGATGDSVAISGDSLNLNTLQDAGGNTIFVSDGSGTITSQYSNWSALNWISSQTASGSASLSFTSGIDSIYDVYIFKFIDINPATDQVDFTFQANAVGESGYNETITTTFFRGGNRDDDGDTTFGYRTGLDQAQGTAFQPLAEAIGNAADENCAGELYLFGPSSTTYVKHFFSKIQGVFQPADDPSPGNYAMVCFAAGNFNTTTAIDDIQFKFSTGNFDGTIALYGISKS